MNIMFVTVTERTREIGVRRAMGATRASVQTQFLVEAVLLCALSGAAGVLLGFVASTVFAHALGWVMIIPPRAIVIAVLFSGLIGVGFGFYPARKAALLDPIEALRYE
jgi:putative ABC transport system permease protein